MPPPRLPRELRHTMPMTASAKQEYFIELGMSIIFSMVPFR